VLPGPSTGWTPRSSSCSPPSRGSACSRPPGGSGSPAARCRRAWTGCGTAASSPDPAALGYEVTAFITLEIRQAGGHDPVAERLATIPEVLEVHTITGTGDMLCRVVARTNADLQRVLDAIVSAEGVVRSSTLISLATQVPYRILHLVRAAASDSGPA
jgi:hypothetical protein